MELLKFDEIFTEEDISNYDLFIGKLKQLMEKGYTTKDILGLVYQYYQKYVTYNYDQLQIVKMNRYDEGKPSTRCFLVYQDILKRVTDINEISKEGKEPLTSIIEKAERKPYSKEKAVQMLDEVFLQVEGRELTEQNKELLFSKYGQIVHEQYEPSGTPTKSGKITITRCKRTEHDIISPPIGDYPPVYVEGMLKDGVCSTYACTFEKRICNDLGIKHIIVDGIGTTGHVWSLIYLPEEQRWVHFDMTMVKFYQDGWIKEHEPYTEQDWIAATTDEIFKMQPTRQIHSINGKKCYFDINNYGSLDVRDFFKISEVEPIHHPDKVLERPLNDRGCIVTREEMARIVELPCLKATLLLYDKNIQTIGTSANKENIRT